MTTPRAVSGKRDHAFLSYCRDNLNDVFQLRAELETRGEVIWWDQDILPGIDWKHAVNRAMAAAYAGIFCFSRELEGRIGSVMYVELRNAISALREHAPGTPLIIPVRLSPCEIPDLEIDATRTLRSLQVIDLFPASRRAAAIDRIVLSLRSSPYHP